jgi:thymidylate synthase (FAD)
MTESLPAITAAPPDPFVDSCTVELIDQMGDDLRVVNAARVSFDRHRDDFDDRDAPGSDARLLAYLAKNQHWTPFGHVVVTLRLTMPVFVARQWMRSNIGTVRNEVSRRYVDEPPTYYLPAALHGRPKGSIKQGAGDPHPDSDYWLDRTAELVGRIAGTYQQMIDAGIAPEEARMILPLCHLTSMVETGSLAYFARVVRLRADHHAQGAIRDLAKLVGDAVRPVAPISWAALVGA